jgi:hypothetical protein
MSLLALADMTGSQYLAVAGDVASGAVVVNTSAGSRSLGVFAVVTTDTAGKAKTATGGDIVHGVALEAGVTGALVTVALGGI